MMCSNFSWIQIIGDCFFHIVHDVVSKFIQIMVYFFYWDFFLHFFNIVVQGFVVYHNIRCWVHNFADPCRHSHAFLSYFGFVQEIVGQKLSRWENHAQKFFPWDNICFLNLNIFNLFWEVSKFQHNWKYLLCN